MLAFGDVVTDGLEIHLNRLVFNRQVKITASEIVWDPSNTRPRGPSTRFAFEHPALQPSAPKPAHLKEISLKSNSTTFKLYIWDPHWLSSQMPRWNFEVHAWDLPQATTQTRRLLAGATAWVSKIVLDNSARIGLYLRLKSLSIHI